MIVKDSINYIALINENKYKAKELAFQTINNNPNILNTGSSDGLLFQTFHNSVKNSNIGKFDKIQKHITGKNFTAAKALNLTINPINLIETNCKEVNRIYLDRIVYDSIVSTNDSLILVNIALQSPSIGGKAVYKARALLYLYPQPDSLLSYN